MKILKGRRSRRLAILLIQSRGAIETIELSKPKTNLTHRRIHAVCVNLFVCINKEGRQRTAPFQKQRALLLQRCLPHTHMSKAKVAEAKGKAKAKGRPRKAG